MHRDIASPLFFLPLKLGGLGVGSAVQRNAAAPWRAWTQILFFVQHHYYVPNSLNSNPPSLNK